MERRKGNKKIRKGRKNIFATVSWLVRWLLRTFHSFSLLRQSRAGFVIPTALMLLLVMSLVISSMLIRTSQRTQQVIGERESQFTDNAATPAIERAKAKIEYLFKSDPRLPVGVPSENKLEALMLNVDDTITTGNPDHDTYTLPGEERLKIPKDVSGNDYKRYNAWSFTQDTDGDGVEETILYSILMKAENEGIPLEDADKEKKAYAQVTRSGPLGISTALGTSENCNIEVLQPGKGWYEVDAISQRKNFQVNAVVMKEDNAVATLEYHQDRQVDKGNKWSAWFLYDLGLNPSLKFRLNGALHSEGSIMVGTDDHNNITRGFESFLISSPNSCIFSDEASKITITEKTEENGDITYQGQLVAVNALTGDLGEGSTFHDPNQMVVTIGNDSDSLINNFSDYNALTLDPVALFTENKFQARGSDGNGSTNEVRDSNWNGINGRVVTKQVDQPFLDDTYRADNRWGPRPSYNSRIVISKTITDNENYDITDSENYDAVVAPSEYGNLISNTPDLENEIEDQLITDDTDTNSLVDLGLDGYWERRARAEGLRLIVGQRLELGNANGWGGSGNTNVRDDDPLYPYNVASPTNAAPETVKNLDLQRRTLRDNLAAVQATAVYHHEEGNNGYFPVTILASTSHPGTSTTWTDSTTFDTVITPNRVDTDFLIGKGTNGWEFEPPAGSETIFASRYNTTNSPTNSIHDLRKALKNLAHFAGDPAGAFPPTQDTFGATDAVVHPYPYLTMWGDFSNLRRIVDGSISDYDELSIADKSTLHTAASALGMLAYNIENRTGIIGQVATKENGVAGSTRTPNMRQLGAYLWELVDGTADPDNPEIAEGGITNSPGMFDADYYYNFTPHDYREAVKLLINEQSLDPSQKEEWKNYVDTTGKQIWEVNQINRDRSLGFASGVNTIGAGDGDLTWDTSNGMLMNLGFKTACHPEEFQDFFPNSLSQDTRNSLSQDTRRQRKVALALAFCDHQPYYPALYYLFPLSDHSHGTNAEEYERDIYINSVNINSVNPSTLNYEIVNLANIALTPRPIGSWKLPVSSLADDDNSEVTNNKSKIQGSAVGDDRYLAIQDKAFYDGQQLMLVRALEINLKLLRQNRIETGEDWWLPKSGIVYGFREDAVREDGIARPKNADCRTVSDTTITSEDCRMNARSTDPQDPPKNTDTGVSPKPVDFYPDPDRRPYGFRLKNGAVLYRGSVLSTDDVTAGMSFISDNPIYIQGDFNLHSTDGSTETLIEEFKGSDKLEDNWSNFYDRTNLNTDFARNNKDTWRPTEILGDVVTILSNNFCDGYIEDGLAYIYGDCPGVAKSRSSYLNSALTDSGTDLTTINFMREENANKDTPIRVDRNGNIYSGNLIYNGYSDRKAVRTYNSVDDWIGIAAGQTVNAVIIGGLSPTRADQNGGGLFVLPHLLEDWFNFDQKILNIQGSFLQVNFSVYATAPFDQDAWNVSRAAIEESSGEFVASGRFYNAPDRKWGYDVALQYRPPAPISDRFVTLGSPRNEFYQEMPPSDPYNQLLFCAKDSNNKKIYPKLCKNQNGGDENGN